MRIVLLTNDNFFSFTVFEKFFNVRRDDVKLVVFSSALIGKRGTFASIKWSLENTGFRHTVFKLMVYGIFRVMKIFCRLMPFIPNKYSSRLYVERNGLKAVDAADINSPEIMDLIKEADPDLIVSVSMNQIVKKEILEMPSKGCINVHCAPLPRYAGMSPYVWALANNEGHSAATIHYMEEGLDEGDIIVQEKIPVVKKDSAFSLFYRCCIEASSLLCETVDAIETGYATSYKQDLSQKLYFSWPTKKCISDLKANGFCLARFGDFVNAIFKQKSCVK